MSELKDFIVHVPTLMMTKVCVNAKNRFEAERKIQAWEESGFLDVSFIDDENTYILDTDHVRFLYKNDLKPNEVEWDFSCESGKTNKLSEMQSELD